MKTLQAIEPSDLKHGTLDFQRSVKRILETFETISSDKTESNFRRVEGTHKTSGLEATFYIFKNNFWVLTIHIPQNDGTTNYHLSWDNGKTEFLSEDVKETESKEENTESSLETHEDFVYNDYDDEEEGEDYEPDLPTADGWEDQYPSY